MKQDQIVIYQTEDGQTQIDVRLENETVWLTQTQMAQLFKSSRTNVLEHIQHIYEEEELEKEATCRNFRQVRQEGKRMVNRTMTMYRLCMTHYYKVIMALLLMATTAAAQENLQRGAKASEVKKTFTTVKVIPITSVKNQWRSGTCWAYATLGYLETEILRQTGRVYDLCEMFVVSKDYMDCATHYVRMHGYSQISEGGSCDDVLEVIRQHGICPENAMPAPGSLTGDSLANFNVFFPELERRVSGIVRKDAKEPLPHWQDSVQAVIEKYLGRCPESFEYNGKTFTPRSFAESLGLNLDDYVSLTSYTHHPFNKWFVIEAPYKWRLKPSYNIPIDELMTVLDKALDAGYTVAWGGDVTGDFTRTGLAMLPDGVQPTQQLRQEQWDDWRMTYDHVMVIYGKAVDEQGKPYYMVKNSWGESGQYEGIWYMSRDYIALNTTYLFLNRHALPPHLTTISTPF